MEERWFKLNEKIPNRYEFVKVNYDGDIYFGHIISEIEDVKESDNISAREKREIIKDIENGKQPRWRFYNTDEYDDDVITNFPLIEEGSDISWAYAEPLVDEDDD